MIKLITHLLPIAIGIWLTRQLFKKFKSPQNQQSICPKCGHSKANAMDPCLKCAN